MDERIGAFVMRRIPSWDEYFLTLAYQAASRSKDPSTQVGAILVGTDNQIVSTGYNGLAPGALETSEIWNDRKQKYPRVLHAEMNAISRAAKLGIATKDTTIYVTHFPCNECAKLIIAAGIKKVIADNVLDCPAWERIFHRSSKLLTECGVSYSILNRYSSLFYFSN